MKKWNVKIKYNFGLWWETTVEANTKRKANIKALEKCKKEKGADTVMQIAATYEA